MIVSNSRLVSILRRSEQIANEVLRQAFELRGKCPEPASIALTALSSVYFMRNQLAQAHQLLVRAAEVDPNPASRHGQDPSGEQLPQAWREQPNAGYCPSARAQTAVDVAGAIRTIGAQLSLELGVY